VKLVAAEQLYMLFHAGSSTARSTAGGETFNSMQLENPPLAVIQRCGSGHSGPP